MERRVWEAYVYCIFWLIRHFLVKIRKMTHSISPNLYDARQIQPQILV